MLKQLINYESKENTISKLNIKFTNFRVKSQNHKNHSFITNLKDLKINKIDRTYKSMIQ